MIVGSKWMFKIKYNSDGSIQKHKTRMVTKDSTQIYFMNYEETFSLVPRQETIRMVLSLATNKQLKVYHMDVKSSFLNS